MSEINNSNKQIRLPLIIALAISIGIVIGTFLVEPKAVSVHSSQAISKFREVLTNIDQNYVDSVNSNELVDQAIINILEELDPHTAYVPANDLELANMHLKGGYNGIGVQFDIIRDTIVVVKPNEGGPAHRAGLRAGDRIIMVEDEQVAGIDLDNRDVTDRLLGKKGTKVNVTVKHFGETELKEYTITRGKIPQKTVVAAYMATDDIGYIKLASFGSKSYSEFKSALVMLKEDGMQKLILDLQGNGGGYMSAAEKIADELIGGSPVIVSQVGKVDRYTSTVNASKDGVFEDQPIIVLIDEYSASASEIVAGALQDNDRALIVGRRSYGKGLVQLPINLSDGSELRLTIARYYTPSGRSIQKPYVKGEDLNYSHDLLQRYENGELFYEDSIKLNDSLRYTTPKGRVVYGGGGIMPDRFVPYDSAMNTELFNSLISSRVLREFTLEYYLKNKIELENYTLEAFIDSFSLGKRDLRRLFSMAEERNLSFSEAEYNQIKMHLLSYLKAEIARSVWDDEGFYPIYNAVSNMAFDNALHMFDDAQALVMNP